MGPIHAFSTGIRRALACWPAWLMLFLASLIVAVPLALHPGSSLLPAAYRPVIQDMTSGFKTSQIIDVVRQAMDGLPVADQPGLKNPQITQFLISLGLLLVLLPLLGGFVSAFFWGGVLVTYREAGKDAADPAEQPAVGGQAETQLFHLGLFFWGCWHWFGSFLLLAVIQAGLSVVVGLLLIAMFAAASALGTVGSIAAAVIIVLFLALWLAVFELARVECVVTDTRNPFLGIGRSIALIFTHMPVLIAFYALALAALVLVHLLFRGALMPGIPASAALLALLVQQAFILARLFALALRLAGLMAIAQAYRPANPVQVVSAPESAPYPGVDAMA